MNISKKKTYNTSNYLIIVLGMIVYFIILLSILNRGLGYNSIFSLVFLVIIVAVILKYKKKIINFLIEKKKIIKIIIILLLVAGFVLRFSFLFIQDRFVAGEVLSDTGVHWYGSQQIVENGQLSEEVGRYERIYPYLSSYTGLLSISKMIFGDGYVAILMLNIFFDVVSCIVIYIIFYLWRRDKDIALFAMTVWMINPLQIIFCGLPLAIVIVNTFVLLSIMSVYLLFINRGKTNRVCLLSSSIGVVLAIGNAFRPIFLVFLLAILMYWLTINMREHKKNIHKNSLISCVLIVICYILVGILPIFLHEQINPYYQGEKARAGWGVFVGANYETGGRWSRDDSREFFGPILTDEANGDVEQAQSIIMQSAINRYIEIFLNGNLVQHFANKITVVFGDVKNSIYDFPKVFRFSDKNTIYKIIQDAILMFYHSTIIVIGYHIYTFIKKERKSINGDFFIYLILLFVGLFMAFLLVEAMNRYSLPFIAIMIVIALGLVFREKKSLL